MNDLRQAAEMALDALRYTTDHLPAKTGVEREVDEAITALQVALAHPEQRHVIDCPRCGHCCPERRWVGLTDEDIDSYALDIGVTANKAPQWLVKYARDVEAKLKDKNSALYTKLDLVDWEAVAADQAMTIAMMQIENKKEWVGLTDADKHEAFDEIQEASGGFWEFADYLDAKLKEKNG